VVAGSLGPARTCSPGSCGSPRCQPVPARRGAARPRSPPPWRPGTPGPPPRATRTAPSAVGQAPSRDQAVRHERGFVAAGIPDHEPPPGRPAAGPRSLTVVAASNGDDPGNDQQQRKDQAPHQPAIHGPPHSVVCQNVDALTRLSVTVSLRWTSARGVTRQGRETPGTRVPLPGGLVGSKLCHQAAVGHASCNRRKRASCPTSQRGGSRRSRSDEVVPGRVGLEQPAPSVPGQRVPAAAPVEAPVEDAESAARRAAAGEAPRLHRPGEGVPRRPHPVPAAEGVPPRRWRRPRAPGRALRPGPPAGRCQR
jgi:hypothetical protein